eukprot:15001-Heterococcus_DN1.PRE.3
MGLQSEAALQTVLAHTGCRSEHTLQHLTAALLLLLLILLLLVLQQLCAHTAAIAQRTLRHKGLPYCFCTVSNMLTHTSWRVTFLLFLTHATGPNTGVADTLCASNAPLCSAAARVRFVVRGVHS